MNVFNLTPSVKKDEILHCEVDGLQRYITIVRKDWTAITLATALTSAFNNVHKVDYDKSIIGFVFTPPIYILPNTTCFKQLGIVPGYTGPLGNSQLPINLSGLTAIQVETTFSFNNTPSTGILAIIPASVKYGDIIKYSNESTDFASMCVDFEITNVSIRLLDQDGDPLVENIPDETLDPYYFAPWDINLYIETNQIVENETFPVPSYN